MSTWLTVYLVGVALTFLYLRLSWLWNDRYFVYVLWVIAWPAFWYARVRLFLHDRES